MPASFNKAETMISDGIRLLHAADPCGTKATTEPHHRLRLLIVMAEGRAGTLPEAWRSYGQIEDARASALEALHNPHVLRVAIVEDGSVMGGSVNPLDFVEWVGEFSQAQDAADSRAVLTTMTPSGILANS